MTAASALELDARIGRRVARRLAPLLWALSAGFAFFAGVTLLVRPPGATLPLAAIDVGGALLLAAGAALVQARGIRPGAANPLAALALILTAAASLAAIKLLHLPAQTTNLLLVALLASIVLLHLRWLAAVLFAALAGWGIVAWSEGITEEWLNAGFSLVAASIMAVTIQFVRLRDARRYEALTAREHDKASQLESTVAAVREHARALASANQSLEAFAYVISHDLKEPIRATRFLLEEARASESGSDREDLLGRAIGSHERLAALAQGLLEWSRATTAPIEPVEVDVEELLKEGATRAQFERALEERRAKLLVESGLPRILGTPALVRQVLGNLILNAAKHTDRPDAQVRVYAAPDTTAGTVDLVVEDNGPGFPTHVLAAPRVVEPGHARSGFGLLIAHRAAERMGGSIHLSNRPEGGARVHVVLPAAASAVTPLSRLSPSSRTPS